MGRSILAVVAGYVTMAVCVAVVLFITAPLFGVSLSDPGEPSTGFSIANLILGFPCGVLGGYVAGAVARNDEMRHAFILGMVGVILGIFNIIVGSGQKEPLYSRIVLVLYVLPASLLGGMIRSRTRSMRRA